VRDEAHRFAITYQRQKRGKRMVESILDDVPGLGEARKKAVLRQFGSLKRLRSASVEELSSVPGIGPTVAQAVVDALAASAPAPAVNTATGEIVE
jgi:excinuclease ABC subunit C